jgi:hypothetical protein
MNTLDITVGDGHKLRVTYLPNRRRYLAYYLGCSTSGERRSGRNSIACYRGFSDEARGESTIVGEIVVYAKNFTPDIVAHEVAHFLFERFRVLGLRLDIDEPYPGERLIEETWCGYMDHLVDAIMGWKAMADADPSKYRDKQWQSSVTLRGL